MPDGFRVDVTALQRAAIGVVNVIDAASVQKVSDIDVAKSAFGHDHLAGTVSAMADNPGSAAQMMLGTGLVALGGST